MLHTRTMRPAMLAGVFAITLVLLPAGASAQQSGYPKGTVFDVDLDAYQVGWRWKPHTADKEDWAYPGHQCGGR